MPFSVLAIPGSNVHYSRESRLPAALCLRLWISRSTPQSSIMEIPSPSGIQIPALQEHTFLAYHYVDTWKALHVST